MCVWDECLRERDRGSNELQRVAQSEERLFSHSLSHEALHHEHLLRHMVRVGDDHGDVTAIRGGGKGRWVVVEQHVHMQRHTGNVQHSTFVAPARTCVFTQPRGERETR